MIEKGPHSFAETILKVETAAGPVSEYVPVVEDVSEPKDIPMMGVPMIDNNVEWQRFIATLPGVNLDSAVFADELPSNL